MLSTKGLGRGAEWGGGRQWAQKRGNSYGNPMEILWKSYGLPMEHHHPATIPLACHHDPTTIPSQSRHQDNTSALGWGLEDGTTYWRSRASALLPGPTRWRSPNSASP